MPSPIPRLVSPRRPRVLAGLLALGATLLVLVAGPPRDAARAAVGANMMPAPCAPGDVIHRLGPGLYSIGPRHGFRLDLASDAELACYGFGRRPPATDRAAVASWAARVRHLRYIVPRVATTIPGATRAALVRDTRRGWPRGAPVGWSGPARYRPANTPAVAPRSGTNCYPAAPS